MKIYTILLWHLEANIAVWLISMLLSATLGVFIPDSLQILFYLFIYVLFIALSYFHLSDMGSKDMELQKFSLLKCLISGILAITLNALLILPDIPGPFSGSFIKTVLTSVPYHFIYLVKSLKNNLRLSFLIFLLLNIPVFTLFYYVGKLQYTNKKV